MSEDTRNAQRPGCGCMILAVLPLAILLIFSIVVILRAAVSGG